MRSGAWYKDGFFGNGVESDDSETEANRGQSHLINAIVSSGISENTSGYCYGYSMSSMLSFQAGKHETIGATLMESIANADAGDNEKARSILSVINTFQTSHPYTFQHFTGNAVTDSLGIVRLNVNDKAIIRSDDIAEIKQSIPEKITDLLTACLEEYENNSDMPEKISIEFFCGVNMPEVPRHAFNVSINLDTKEWLYYDANRIDTQVDNEEKLPYTSIPVGQEWQLGKTIYDDVINTYEDVLDKGVSLNLNLEGIMFTLKDDGTDFDAIKTLDQLSKAHVLSPTPRASFNPPQGSELPLDCIRTFEESAPEPIMADAETFHSDGRDEQDGNEQIDLELIGMEIPLATQYYTDPGMTGALTFSDLMEPFEYAGGSYGLFSQNWETRPTDDDLSPYLKFSP